MSCSRCTTVPESNFGKCRVYISVPVNDLFSKIKNAVQAFGSLINLSDNHLEVDVEDFESFIYNLSLSKIFSEKESEDISILPVKHNTVLDFREFSKTKTLRKWMSIVNSKDLIYILSNKSLATFFQPIVNINNNTIYGHELLSRGIKENGKLMSPFEMFKLAKESGLIFNLDRQARETAIINASKHNLKSKLFINFIPTAIYDPSVCLKSTLDTIIKYKMDTNQVTFEVVETEQVTDTGHLKTILDFYRTKGFNIALDDVGSGYSSLNNLALLCPDYIKIDMEIIRDIHKHKLKQSIFEALVSIAKSISISVLAEGVESSDELEYVKAHGADLVQGYYFSKPTEQPLLKL